MSTEEKNNLLIEYTAELDSQMMTGKVNAAVLEKGLILKTIFDTAEIPYAEIQSLELKDYILIVEADCGMFRFSKMGNWLEPFYNELYSAYNKKVRKALFVNGSPLMKVGGQYYLEEYGERVQGTAEIEIYEDCLLILPPNDGARRIPLCFVTSINKDDFKLSLQLDTEERYTFTMLGYDSEPFAETLMEQLRLMREKTLLAVKEIDPLLTPQQAFTIAKKMPKGIAAPLGSLTALAPSFADALEKKIQESRSAEEYIFFKSLCDPEKIWVGFHAFEEKESKDGEEGFHNEGILWLIVPGRNGNRAAVEFVVAEEESAATFIYRFEGGFDGFARRFNRALEAISFRREVIRLPEDTLQKPEYADYAMCIRRNAALQFVRGSFASRVIHASIGSWKKKIEKYLKEGKEDLSSSG
jgi:hypothetical protein